MKLLVYGSKSYARLVRDLAEGAGHEFAGYIDDSEAGPDIVGGYDAARQRCPPGQYGIALGIGYRDLPARARVLERVRRDGYEMPAIVHARAYVRDASSVASGAVVMAHAAVESNASIGEGCVLWTAAVVSHDSKVGPNCFLSPNSTVCGFVRIGRDCFIGAGATVVDHRSVPDGTFVKAGAVFA